MLTSMYICKAAVLAVALPVLVLGRSIHGNEFHNADTHCDEPCELYLHTLKGSLTGILLETPGVQPAQTPVSEVPFNALTRHVGKDWPQYGLTMIGALRMDNLQKLVAHIIERKVPGDMVECGVWRGGASIFMRGMLKAYGVSDRAVHLVDSFDGLPHASTAEDHDMWATMDYLKVPLEDVKAAFKRYHLLDGQVRFHKGFFQESLPLLSSELTSQQRQIALLRMDGDMYESTMDQLYNLAVLLSPGGCIIIDDWHIPECKKAVNEFLVVHDMSPTIYDIDGSGAYFCSDKHIDVKHSHYAAFNTGRKIQA